MSWNKEWIGYRGPVRVIVDDMNFIRGEAFDAIASGDVVAMGVRREDGEEIYFHPRDVFPTSQEEMA